ncbi:MAG: substrate-binding domain-containing protein, partial [Xenococcaceae cyanobacterium MO_167.B27]|nr:substrate-binding domain-containing protein [Xenococcaceae cyanobacterium MO_167.B27]
FAQNALPLTVEELNEANRRGKELESIPVAKDGIVFYVNKTNGIKSLTLEQVRDIYLGKITNWREVGGEYLPITPITLAPSTNQALELVMGEDDVYLPKKVKIVRDYTTAIRQVASTPGAISYASSAIMLGQSSIRPIALSKNSETVPFSALKDDGTVNLQAFERNNYPITRQLYVVIRRDGTKNEKAGVAYANFLVSSEGQTLVRKAGFVPIY